MQDYSKYKKRVTAEEEIRELEDELIFYETIEDFEEIRDALLKIKHLRCEAEHSRIEQYKVLDMVDERIVDNMEPLLPILEEAISIDKKYLSKMKNFRNYLLPKDIYFLEMNKYYIAVQVIKYQENNMSYHELAVFHPFDDCLTGQGEWYILNKKQANKLVEWVKATHRKHVRKNGDVSYI